MSYPRGPHSTAIPLKDQLEESQTYNQLHLQLSPAVLTSQQSLNPNQIKIHSIYSSSPLTLLFWFTQKSTACHCSQSSTWTGNFYPPHSHLGKKKKWTNKQTNMLKTNPQLSFVPANISGGKHTSTWEVPLWIPKYWPPESLTAAHEMHHMPPFKKLCRLLGCLFLTFLSLLKVLSSFCTSLLLVDGLASI